MPRYCGHGYQWGFKGRKCEFGDRRWDGGGSGYVGREVRSWGWDIRNGGVLEGRGGNGMSCNLGVGGRYAGSLMMLVVDARFSLIKARAAV